MRKAEPLGPADHALLGLVRIAPRHGYELAECFEPDGEVGEVCTLHPSLLYARLKRLESIGYLANTTEIVGGRPPRHVYSLTDAGEAEFWRWLDQPVRRNRDVRMDFLLKLYFSARIPEHDTVRLIDAQLVVARDLVDAIRVEMEGVAAGSFSRLLRQARLVATQGTIRWLEEYRAEVIGQGEKGNGAG